MPIKFEGQFKDRDESKVNAQSAPAAMKIGKCPTGANYSRIEGFGLPCGFAK
jgi:hypothetical protein